jgi:hypothetical protein
MYPCPSSSSSSSSRLAHNVLLVFPAYEVRCSALDALHVRIHWNVTIHWMYYTLDVLDVTEARAASAHCSSWHVG